MRQTEAKKLMRAMTLLILLLIVVTAQGCSNQAQHSTSWPKNLNVIQLNDGGVCLDGDSARRLAEFRADLEAL